MQLRAQNFESINVKLESLTHRDVDIVDIYVFVLFLISFTISCFEYGFRARLGFTTLHACCLNVKANYGALRSSVRRMIVKYKRRNVFFEVSRKLYVIIQGGEKVTAIIGEANVE